MEYKPLTPQYDTALAGLIRSSLKAHQLDIPGTVYFDEGLDHLSEYYDGPGRAYYVLVNEGVLIGGIGLAKFSGFDKCCELQKLYLSDEAKGHGLGYKMIEYIEDKARPEINLIFP
ncbi:MAG: GNAT family N-acetyltransferase [Lachnospiraceae bacterium]|nr:GNAT family N-acetyltransferase [Lachnospiraceae bacterium]